MQTSSRVPKFGPIFPITSRPSAALTALNALRARSITCEAWKGVLHHNRVKVEVEEVKALKRCPDPADQKTSFRDVDCGSLPSDSTGKFLLGPTFKKKHLPKTNRNILGFSLETASLSKVRAAGPCLMVSATSSLSAQGAGFFGRHWRISTPAERAIVYAKFGLRERKAKETQTHTHTSCMDPQGVDVFICMYTYIYIYK